MRRIFALTLLAIFAIVSLAEAAPTNFVWDRNTETDMLEYGVYSCSSSATNIPKRHGDTRAKVAEVKAHVASSLKELD